MRKTPLIVGNWKMHPQTKKEALSLFKKIVKKIPSGSRVVIAPPVTFLPLMAEKYRGKKISFASQDVFFEEEGSFTGEVSPLMIKGVGASYVIIGHSERRLMGEGSDVVRKKVRAALDSKLIPIVCVGERERDKEGLYLGLLKDQIEESLRGILPTEVQKIIIAYEPVWAIGDKSSGAIESKDLYTIAIFIRKALIDLFGEKANTTAILYGGSVDTENASALMRDGHMQGLLVGRESLIPEDFGNIIRLANRNA